MTIISTETVSPSGLPPLTNLQVYNGLDCCVTLEVFQELLRIHGPKAGEPIYSFERALQAPYLAIMQRGFAVNETARRGAADSLRGRIIALQARLDSMGCAVWNKGLNPRSPKQLKDFFYSTMNLPEQWISIKGERKLSLNREVLEKLDEHYLYARPFVGVILAIRDLAKQAEVFEAEIDSDGRYRTSYNIAGTETGRPSSSTNAFGTGGNAQNIAPGLRYVFQSDPGYKLCVIDLEQVEARDVGFFCGCLFNDWGYLDGCESGDLHTNNAKRIWPGLDWPGDNAKGDRAIADRNFYREFSYRDMAKRGSHLSNYMGTAWTASRSLKVPIGIMDEFQARYVRGRVAAPAKGLAEIQPAFPEIPRWWSWIAEQLQTRGWIRTPFGRKRHFFGRPGDDTTLREAIAFLPQSTTADRMNLGLWRVWRYMPQVELLAQTYDSITFQVKEGPGFDEAVGRALELIRVELKSPGGRSYIVPGEAKVGWNWGAEVSSADVTRAVAQGRKAPRLNSLGLRKWRPGGDLRVRPTGLALTATL